MERFRSNKFINGSKMSPKVLVLALCGFAVAVLTIGSIYALQNDNPRRVSLTRHQLDTCGEGKVQFNSDDTPEKAANCLDAGFYGEIKLGTPKQKFEVMFDTGSADFWVPSDKCESKQCLVHSRYASESSSTYVDEGNPLRIDYGLGDMEAATSFDEVTIADLSFEKQKFGQALRLPKTPFKSASYDGIIGLGFESQSKGYMKNPIQNMVDQGLFQEPVFSFYLNPDQTQKPGGEIILGKIDQDLFEGDITYTKLVDDNWWQINFDSVSLVDGSKDKFSVCEGGCQAIIDTGTSLITAPKRYAVILNEKIGAKGLVEGIFYLPSCNFSNFPDLEIRIGGRSFTLKPEQYVLKVKSSTGEPMCISGIAGMNLEPFNDGPLWIFGNMFVGHFYTVFDLGQKRIGFAEAKK